MDRNVFSDGGRVPALLKQEPTEGFAWRLDLQHHAWTLLNGKAIDVT